MKQFTREELKLIKENLNCRHCGKKYENHFFGTTICSHHHPEIFEQPGALYTCYEPDETEIERLILKNKINNSVN